MAKALSKSQLATAIAEKSEISKKQAVDILEHIASLAYEHAQEGFTLPGLGKLVLVDRKARMGRNPITKEPIQIPAKRVVKFRVAKACKDAILGAPAPSSPAPPAETPPAETPPLRALVLGTRWDREELRGRIATRLKERLAGGLIEEVNALHAAGCAWERLELLGLEYRFVAQYLQGGIKRQNDLFQKLNGAIARFAKRQETWFRRMERRGTEIQWVDRADVEAALEKVRAVQWETR